MKLMVIGGGGREHAIIKKLKENPAVEKIYCLPGNGGIAAESFANALLASMTAAFLSGPKQGMPAALSASTAPRARGSSGATMAFTGMRLFHH